VKPLTGKQLCRLLEREGQPFLRITGSRHVHGKRTQPPLHPRQVPPLVEAIATLAALAGKSDHEAASRTVGRAIYFADEAPSSEPGAVAQAIATLFGQLDPEKLCESSTLIVGRCILSLTSRCAIPFISRLTPRLSPSSLAPSKRKRNFEAAPLWSAAPSTRRLQVRWPR
jgi:hypothetical protein